MNLLKTSLLMTAMFVLMMLFGAALGGRSGIVMGFGFALVTNFISYWFSDKIVLSTCRAREVSEMDAPQLHQMVRALSQRAGLPMPRVYIVPTNQPNAFATGRGPNHAVVAVTEGILQALNPSELEGVLAHELAHIKHRDILLTSIVAVFAATISMVAMMVRWGMMFGGYGRSDRDEGENPLVLLALAIFAPIAAVIIQLAISRAREYEADREGALICRDPLALASALTRLEAYAERMPQDMAPSMAHMYIVNPLGGDMLRNMATLFRTHPTTPDRVARLRAMANDL